MPFLAMTDWPGCSDLRRASAWASDSTAMTPPSSPVTIAGPATRAASESACGFGPFARPDSAIVSWPEPSVSSDSAIESTSSTQTASR